MNNFIDTLMLQLAETGKVSISEADHWCGMEDDIRAAAREDGVQIRTSLDAYWNLIVTLRKIGLGH
jgi:hypothetical protein